MTTDIGSLWSTEIKPTILSPRQILSSQAKALAEMTKGILIGELSESKREDQEIILILDMVAPVLNYRHRVLTARHSARLLYSVHLDADVFRPKGLQALTGMGSMHDILQGKKPESQADTDDQLVRLVQRVLTSSEVVSMAQSLIALSNEAHTRTHFVQRLKGLPEAERQAAIDEKIAETYHQIVDSEAFVNAIAETNASGWGVDDYEVEHIDLGETECVVKLNFSASGDQEQEKMYAGDRMSGTAEAVIDATGAVEYREITAEVEHDPEDQDAPGEVLPEPPKPDSPK
jgi:hypothetical protein